MTKNSMTESIWREAHSGGFVAEIRGLRQANGVHEWIRLGVYGSRSEAERAIRAARREGQ